MRGSFRFAPWHVICVGLFFFLALAFSLTAFTVIDDEAATHNLLIDQPFSQMMRFHLSGLSEHPPLFDILQWFWVKIFGQSIAARRSHTLIYAVMALIIAWPLLVHSFGSRIAFYAYAAIFLSPFLFLMAHAAHWYIAFFAFSLASVSLFIRLLEDVNWKTLALFTVVNTVLTYLNYFGLVFLALYAAYPLLIRASRSTFGKILGSLFVTFLFFLGWLPIFLRSASIYLNAPINIKDTVLRAAYFLFVLTNGESVPLASWFLFLTAFTILMLVLTGWLIRKYFPPIWFLFAFLFFGLLLTGSWFGVFESAKRAILVAGLYGILVGTILGIAAQVKPRLAACLATGFILCWMVSYSNLISRKDFIAYRWIEPWPEISHSLSQEFLPNDLIICGHPSLLFYLRRQGISPTVYSPFKPGTLSLIEQEHPQRVWYFRTARGSLAGNSNQVSLETSLENKYRLLKRQDFLPDRWASLKRSIFPKHYYPDIRIQMFFYERQS